MKQLFFFTFFLISITFCPKIQALEFYECAWTIDGMDYYGFLIYYDDNDAVMRINFEYNGEVQVAEFECRGEYFEDGGYSGYLLDGFDAYMVHGDENLEYSADNFIFMNVNGEYSTPYHIDDNGLEQHDPDSYITEVSHWAQLSNDHLTEDYLLSFFSSDEEMYEMLLSFSNDGDTFDEPFEEPDTDPVTTTTTKPKMHLIVVANTLISDIGESCKIDRNRLDSEFTIICEELGIELNKTIIDGNQLKKENVTQALNNLSPSSNDIVVFAYTGHGYRWSNQQSRYPQIDIRYSNYQAVANSTSYNLGDIYDKIVGKGARLNLVLGDCCNSDIGVTNRGGESTLSARNQTHGKIQRLKKLFLESKGNLIAAAAQPFETACGNSRDGGYFIHSFFQSLSKETSYLNQDEPNWNTLVGRTIESAKYKTQNLNGCDVQNGIFKMSSN